MHLIQLNELNNLIQLSIELNSFDFFQTRYQIQINDKALDEGHSPLVPCRCIRFRSLFLTNVCTYNSNNIL